MGSCTHMPMIPTVWIQVCAVKFAAYMKMSATCTYTDLWGMDEGIFQNDCWYHAGKAPMALKRRGSSDFFGIPKHIGER